jgi:succinyl-CoA:acetate CoA-transferase
VPDLRESLIMTPQERIKNTAFASKVMSADEAALLISNGSNIGMSGFTGSGYPKAVPEALARRIAEANKHDKRFSVSVWTGASTGPDLDGALAAVDGIDLRMP